MSDTTTAWKDLAMAADRARDGLLDIATSTLVDLTGGERDRIGLIRHLCDEVIDEARTHPDVRRLLDAEDVS